MTDADETRAGLHGSSGAAFSCVPSQPELDSAQPPEVDVIEGAAKGTVNLDPRLTPDGSADADRRHTLTQAHPVSISVDAVADHALRARQAAAGTAELRCDVCDTTIEGEPAGRGLYMWSRGDELRFEEPALCSSCAVAIGVTALSAWNVEEEEG